MPQDAEATQQSTTPSNPAPVANDGKFVTHEEFQRTRDQWASKYTEMINSRDSTIKTLTEELSEARKTLKSFQETARKPEATPTPSSVANPTQPVIPPSSTPSSVPANSGDQSNPLFEQLRAQQEVIAQMTRQIYVERLAAQYHGQVVSELITGNNEAELVASAAKAHEAWKRYFGNNNPSTVTTPPPAAPAPPAAPPATTSTLQPPAIVPPSIAPTSTPDRAPSPASVKLREFQSMTPQERIAATANNPTLRAELTKAAFAEQAQLNQRSQIGAG